MLSNNLSSLKAYIFITEEYTNFFLVSLIVLIVMVPILINKDRFDLVMI